MLDGKPMNNCYIAVKKNIICQSFSKRNEKCMSALKAVSKQKIVTISFFLASNQFLREAVTYRHKHHTDAPMNSCCWRPARPPPSLSNYLK